MESRLRTTNSSCKYLLERAEGLRAQQQTTNTRQGIITLFLERFTLSAAELEAITSRDVPVGKRMFDAMDKLERIREDCRVLMTGEGGETKAGCVVTGVSFTTRLTFKQPRHNGIYLRAT